MGYVILILGVALWAGAHLFKRLAPERRAPMGDGGKGLVAVLLVVSIVLMVWGYRAAPVVDLWYPPGFLVHLNNLLTLIALWLFVGSMTGGRIATRMRHPQLIGFKLWAISHLLVNGDLASILLFGGLLAWSVVQLILINRTGDWAPKAAGPIRRDAIALVVALILWGIVAYVHVWFGLWPFGG